MVVTRLESRIPTQQEMDSCEFIVCFSRLIILISLVLEPFFIRLMVDWTCSSIFEYFLFISSRGLQDKKTFVSESNANMVSPSFHTDLGLSPTFQPGE
jgi:hypothetical protein